MCLLPWESMPVRGRGRGGIPFAAFSNMKCTVALQAGSMIDKHVRMKFNNMARPEERKGKCGKYE